MAKDNMKYINKPGNHTHPFAQLSVNLYRRNQGSVLLQDKLACRVRPAEITRIGSCEDRFTQAFPSL